MCVQEFNQWLRERCIENVFTSAATLRSLAELLDKISNIVINDDIGAQVSYHSASQLMFITLCLLSLRVLHYCCSETLLQYVLISYLLAI